MKSITFLRHAESAANAGLPSSDPGAIPLTEAGRTAADDVARDYDGPPPELIVVSPFRRAQETAVPFRRRFASAFVEEWAVQEFTYLSPARCGTSSAAERRPLVESYWNTATPETNDGPGAESFHDFTARVQVALEKLRSLPEQAILVVCHEMVIKLAMWMESQKPDIGDTHAPQRFREFALTFTIPNLGRWNCPTV